MPQPQEYPDCYCDGVLQRPNCDRCDKLLGFPGNPEICCFGIACLCIKCAKLLFTLSNLSQDNTNQAIADIDRGVALNKNYMKLHIKEL